MINEILQQLGNYALDFTRRNWKQLLFQAAVVAYKEYETYQARSYEKQLHEDCKNYIEKSSEQYKQAAKQIIKQIDEYLSQQNISQKEKEELKDILQRHSSWIN